MKQLNQRKALQALENKINNHIGSSGVDAHIDADLDKSGFMTPNQVLDLSRALGNREWLPEGADILKLKPGNYAGINLVNSTYESGNDGMLMVDVAMADDKHKQILEVESARGAIKYRTIHTSADGSNAAAPKDWSSIEISTLLWSGRVSDSGTVLTLSESVDNYKLLRFNLDCGGNHMVAPTLRINPSMSYGYASSWSAGTSFDILELNMAVSGNKLTISNQLTIHCDSNGVSNLNVDTIKILKVEGIK